MAWKGASSGDVPINQTHHVNEGTVKRFTQHSGISEQATFIGGMKARVLFIKQADGAMKALANTGPESVAEAYRSATIQAYFSIGQRFNRKVRFGANGEPILTDEPMGKAVTRSPRRRSRTNKQSGKATVKRNRKGRTAEVKSRNSRKASEWHNKGRIDNPFRQA